MPGSYFFQCDPIEAETAVSVPRDTSDEGAFHPLGWSASSFYFACRLQGYFLESSAMADIPFTGGTLLLGHPIVRSPLQTFDWFGSVYRTVCRSAT